MKTIAVKSETKQEDNKMKKQNKVLNNGTCQLIEL